MGLIESRLITHQELKQIFVWSRIRAVPDHSDKSVRALRHLSLEDFMEVRRHFTC